MYTRFTEIPIHQIRGMGHAKCRVAHSSIYYVLTKQNALHYEENF